MAISAPSLFFLTLSFPSFAGWVHCKSLLLLLGATEATFAPYPVSRRAWHERPLLDSRRQRRLIRVWVATSNFIKSASHAHASGHHMLRPSHHRRHTDCTYTLKPAWLFRWSFGGVNLGFLQELIIKMLLILPLLIVSMLKSLGRPLSAPTLSVPCQSL